ncbi:winged helix-turn-helix domain-containing protein [Halosimplex pelagicum]|uniref:Winged helix-turn-helix transcriptional regulator n=1 Tax=Halosimplex pelagicum TaxID=869886 RepID=A0A7D5TAZ1_9EURY|nr:winged helix-turn-helix domain-containing protein [Halosimplex pelagicum]QLH83230.1 winged helix-turn-helix transcriptional regulator [Halosimplex pelagicum]
MGDSDESGDRGGRRPVVSDEQILELILDSSDPVVSAPELASEFPVSKTAVYKRLRDLQDRRLVDSKKIGQGRAWWITSEGREFLDDPE